MAQIYNKPPLTFEQQIELLVSRGMIIENKDLALHYLANTNYYRLSAYWYPFRHRKAPNTITDVFSAGTHFEQIIELYEFDCSLRHLLMKAIEKIETSVRTGLAYHLGHSKGSFGYKNPKNFHPEFPHSKWLENVTKETHRSKEAFITHFQKKYIEFPDLPIWMLTEIMSLGNLSQLYAGLLPIDKKKISILYNCHHITLKNWLHILTYVRNICAHHGRLWNREMAIRPPKVKDIHWLPPSIPRNDRIFYILLIVKHLLNTTQRENSWVDEVTTLLLPIAKNENWRIAMGMPQNWFEHVLWK